MGYCFNCDEYTEDENALICVNCLSKLRHSKPKQEY